MYKLVLSGLFLLAAGLVSAEIGVGVSVGSSSGEGKHSVYPQTYGAENFTGTLSLAVGLGEDWELDPFGQYTVYTEHDADDITDGNYIDRYKKTNLGAGASLFRVWHFGDQFRVLAGVGAFAGNETIEGPTVNPDYTHANSLLQAYLPVTAEVRLTRTLGLRAQGNLGVASLTTITDEAKDGSGKASFTITSLSFGSSTLSLGAFLYF